ncbi:MAG: c-type cytochrome [Gemmatimonadota bacterium]
MPVRFSPRVSLIAVAGVLATACSSASSPAPASAPQPAAAPAASSTPALPAGVTLAMIAVGDSIYHKGSCQRCHGMEAKGGPRAPDLTDGTWSQITGTYAEIVQIVTTGVPKDKIKLATAQFAMNPRGGSNLSDEQIKQVAAYVYSLSHK